MISVGLASSNMHIVATTSARHEDVLTDTTPR